MADETKSALHLKSGCASPRRDANRARGTRQREVLSPVQIIQGIRSGDRSLLAKAITLIESSRPEDRRAAEQVIENCLSATGNSIRVGVTGMPGAGKSSLIEALGKYLLTERGEKVAVLTIDPSSQLSGGSILGDKTRMPFLSSSEMAFIRPSPSRGVHGGVARRTPEAILLCESAGYGNIFVETVGVGQSESSIRSLVDFVLIVTIPGAGDELQSIKRGVMEIADLVAVNKADAENSNAAERARTDAENALRLLPISGSGWSPRAITCSAHAGRGIADIWSCVLDYVGLAKANGWFDRARREQSRLSLQEELAQGLLQMFRADPVIQHRTGELERQVSSGQVTTTKAARELLDLFASRAGSERAS